MLSAITLELVYQWIIVFCRVGGTMMLLPAISESFVSIRARLTIAVVFTLLLVPIISKMLPPIPDSGIALFLIIAKEITIGVFIGAVAKMILSAMHVAGMIMAYQSGLAAASLFDPAQGGQSSVFGVLLNFLTIIIIFGTNLHYIFLQGITDSYLLFSPVDPVDTHGFFMMMVKTASSAFLTGFKIASPHIVVGLITYLGAGIMGRLMPQMQVFFVLLPVQVATGFFLFAITLSATMLWFTEYYMEIMGSLLYMSM